MIDKLLRSLHSAFRTINTKTLRAPCRGRSRQNLPCPWECVRFVSDLECWATDKTENWCSSVSWPMQPARKLPAQPSLGVLHRRRPWESRSELFPLWKERWKQRARSEESKTTPWLYTERAVPSFACPTLQRWWLVTVVDTCALSWAVGSALHLCSLFLFYLVLTSGPH